MKKLILIVLIAIPMVGSAQLFRNKKAEPPKVDTVFIDHDYLKTDLSIDGIKKWSKDIPNAFHLFGTDHYSLTDKRLKIPGISGISAVTYDFYYYNGAFDVIEINYYDMFDEEKHLLKEGFVKISENEYECPYSCKHKLIISHEGLIKVHN